MIVLDTSAAIAAVTGRPADEKLLACITDEVELHAPHLIDVEVVHALRRLVRHGVLDENRALDARADFEDLAIVRYPHMALTDRMWELRNNLSAYDAAFVALAEHLEATLVTCDGKVARAPGLRTKVERFGARRR